MFDLGFSIFSFLLTSLSYSKAVGWRALAAEISKASAPPAADGCAS
jgi:hypothetical protein